MIGFIGYCHLLVQEQNATLTIDEMLAAIRSIDAEMAKIVASENSVSVRIRLQPRH